MVSIGLLYHVQNHDGHDKMQMTLQNCYYLPAIKTLMNEITRSCYDCQQYKIHGSANLQKLQNKKVVAKYTFDLLFADLTFLPSDEGKKMILNIVDTASRRAWAFPLKEKTGTQIVDAFKTLIKNDLNQHKIIAVRFDNGKEFSNKVNNNQPTDIITSTISLPTLIKTTQTVETVQPQQMTYSWINNQGQFPVQFQAQMIPQMQFPQPVYGQQCGFPTLQQYPGAHQQPQPDMPVTQLPIPRTPARNIAPPPSSDNQAGHTTPTKEHASTLNDSSESNTPSSNRDVEISRLIDTISSLQESVISLNKSMSTLHTEKLQMSTRIEQLSTSLRHERENVSKLTDTVEKLIQHNTTLATEQAYNTVMYGLNLKQKTGLRNITEETESTNTNSLSRSRDSLEPEPPTVAELDLSSSTEAFISYLDFSRNVSHQVRKSEVVPGINIEEVQGEALFSKVTTRVHNIQTTEINNIIPQDLLTNINAPSISTSHLNRVFNWSQDTPTDATAANIMTPNRDSNIVSKLQKHSTPQVPGSQRDLNIDAADLSRIVDDVEPVMETQEPRRGGRNLRPNPKKTDFYQAGS
ncbi:unnamed protein product [Rotaria magnacalcarata]|uniref:Integrase catalytic domain-containing protein n=1 Tax=Rotaria magnacalcarata TaxID=392030 RepID=A0A819TBS0_9BILA|nr:unnamed protein product [Rotaria magnacalcarata]